MSEFKKTIILSFILIILIVTVFITQYYQI